MSRKVWLIFGVMQLAGVALVFLSMRFEVGTGGWREILWIPATLLLFPGVLFGFLNQLLGLSRVLSNWDGTPFMMIVVLINAIAWSTVAVVVARRRARTNF
jgi:hypothetical protein